MKFVIIIAIGSHTHKMKFTDYTMATKKFEELKKSGIPARLLMDGVEISSTATDTASDEQPAPAATAQVQPVQELAATVEQDVKFFWKEEGIKKMKVFKESKAKDLLKRAEKAGYPAFITDMSNHLIEKVNCEEKKEEVAPAASSVSSVKELADPLSDYKKRVGEYWMIGYYMNGTLKEKMYNTKEDCAKAFSQLKHEKVPFIYGHFGYDAKGVAINQIKSYGLDYGKSITFDDLPEECKIVFGPNTAEGLQCFESENWYGMYYESSEELIRGFATKDGKSCIMWA